MSTKKTVLIVEDDAAISTSLKELLEYDNYQVLTAANGSEALRLLKADASPSVILLDLMMPVMDGFQFREAQLADAAIRDIPVVVMSADGHVADKKEKAAAKEYLKKPLDIYQVLEVIGKFTQPKK